MSRNIKIIQSYTNDTDLNNTDYIKTNSNDMNNMNDTNDTFIKKENTIHSNHQKNKFDTEALKYHLRQELPNHLKAYC
ncbi:hypothetical protein CPA44_00720 [Staphylococcus warneri]|nr:hypothetical protein [Staphylococcus warneri]RQN00975.1 hypothetical protein CPA44_00720 [Staphylococcus warneri]